MAPARVLPLPTAIVVRDARSDAVLAQFLGGKPAGELCDALERLTGSPGCLVLGDKASQGAPLVLTESDVIQSGTYHWRVAITRSSSHPTTQPHTPRTITPATATMIGPRNSRRPYSLYSSSVAVSSCSSCSQPSPSAVTAGPAPFPTTARSSPL
ncbi:unnamed protein product [Closterium sp. Naga37s-1]|nr:unnamed protein product [Closterium sp. Naga37s-1]